MFKFKFSEDMKEMYVSKAFQKKATTYGTPEFRQWREIRNEFPNVQMVVKNNNRTSDIYNTTYKKMEMYIKTFDNAEAILEEMAKVRERSKIQRNPHRYVLAWFEQMFPNYKEAELFQKKEESDAESKVIPMPTQAVV